MAEDLEALITSVRDTLREKIQTEIINGSDPYPIVALVLSRDPRTGEKLKREMVLFVVMVNFSGDFDKDLNAMKIRGIAIAGGARASVFASESFIVTNDPDNHLYGDDGAMKMRVSEHPNRMECIAMTVERAGGASTMEYIAFRRDQGQILFDDAVSKDHSELGGRFVFLPKDPAPPEVIDPCLSGCHPGRS